LMASESPLRRSEFLLDSLFMNSRPFSMERPLVEENPFPDRRGLLNVYDKCGFEPRGVTIYTCKENNKGGKLKK
ncbi:MAG: hypothetical protein L3J03_09845, partial [Desulfobacterales bacterium]|nr:hypothetical protein [Desulfobacterales bacterium]